MWQRSTQDRKVNLHYGGFIMPGYRGAFYREKDEGEGGHHRRKNA